VTPKVQATFGILKMSAFQTTLSKNLKGQSTKQKKVSENCMRIKDLYPS
jgi:hypothetical protein